MNSKVHQGASVLTAGTENLPKVTTRMASTLSPRNSLKTRITLFTLAIFVLSLWSLSFYASQMLRHDMQRLLSEQQFSTVTLMAADVNEQLDIRLRVLDIVAGSISPATLGKTKALQAFLEGLLILQGPFNGGVLVLGPDGTAIADSTRSAGRIGVNYMNGSAIGPALREGKTMIGHPVVGRVLKTPVITMAVPIRDAQGKVIGALAGVTNLGQPNFLDKIARNHYGKTGGYLLVAAQSRLIFAATDNSRVMETLPAAGINPTLDAFLDGYEGSAVMINPQGVEVLASDKGIPVAGWIMAATLPITEAFAPIRTMQQRMLIATLLLTLLAAGLTWWMLRRQLSPLLAAARTLASRSAADQPLQPLPISGQDEISQLIEGFNRLLETLGQREAALKDSEKLLNATQRLSKTGGWVWDVEKKTMNWTEETYRIHDLEQGDISPAFPEQINRGLAFYAQGDRAVILAAFQRCAESGEEYDMEFPFTTAKGREIWIRTTGEAVWADGRVVKVVGNISDITEQKKTIEALLEQEAFFHLIAESIGEFITVVDLEGLRLYNSPSYLRFVGARKDLHGTDSFAEIHPEDLERVKRAFAETVKTGIGRQLDYRFLKADGSIREVESRGSVIRDSAGRVARVVVVSHDVSERKQAEKALQESEAFKNIILNSLTAEIAVLDRDGVIKAVNDRWRHFSLENSSEPGQPAAHTGVGSNYLAVCGVANDLAGGVASGVANEFANNATAPEVMDVRSGIQAVLDGRQPSFSLEYPCHSPHKQRWFTMLVVPLGQGVTDGVVITHTDITERKLLEEQVRQLAFYDNLTQLPNRRLLCDRLAQTMAASARSGIHGALMFLDLDNFKPLNDRHGHEAGDLLLIEAALRMKNCVREMDTVARFGGDEFVVMISELDADKAESLAQAGIIAEKIRIALSEPYRLTVRHAGNAGTKVEHHCTVSIGVALFIDHEASQESILKRADVTMYQAKEAGRNSIRFHDQQSIDSPAGREK